MKMKTTRLLSAIIAVIMVLSILPLEIFPVLASSETEVNTITAYVSVSQNGRLVTGKDGSIVAEIPVKLTGKEHYTLDDALRAVHDICYEGGSPKGYESFKHETYGLSLKTLWGNSSGMFGYQINRGTIAVSGLNNTVKDGDYIDAYINQTSYPDNEAYSVFNKSTYKAVYGSEIGLKLLAAGYDEDFNTVFSDCEGAAITVDGIQLTKIENGTETPVVTNSKGYASFTIDQLGTHIVSAVKYKMVGNKKVTAITSPVCIVTVTEAPRLESLTISNVYNDNSKLCKFTPSFDPFVTEYNLSLPDYSSTVWPTVKLAEETEGKSVGYYAYNSMFGGFSWSSSNSINTSGGYFGVVIYDKSNNISSEDIRYTVNLKKHATLKELFVDGIESTAFDKDITDGYHYYADSTKDGIDIKAVAYKSSYNITICGDEAASDETYHLIYKWDENGRMEVPVTVSGSNAEPYTYNLILEKQPLNDTPYIMIHPTDAEYIIGEETADLNVTASANGNLNYQWYLSSTGSINDGTTIEGACNSIYTPSSDTVGTAYYYCVVTNTDKAINNTAVSELSSITVDPDPTPKATILNPGNPLDNYIWDIGYIYNIGDEAETLNVKAVSDAEGGTWSYKWYTVSTPYNIKGYSSVSGNTTSESYTPSTSESLVNDSGKFYACKVSYTFKGKTYTSWASTGSTFTDTESENSAIYDITGVYVFIKADKASTPVINREPLSASYIVGDRITPLSVSASKSNDGKLLYQWYENDTPDNENGTEIEGAVSSKYTPVSDEKGISKYYYCVITNIVQGHSASIASKPAKITVKPISDLINNKLKGSGTEDDPYLIENAEDYIDIAELTASGLTFKGMFLKQTAETITLTDNWSPIGISKTKTPFSGILDGNNNTIVIPEGGLPLLGYVVGAEVKNLNIYGKKIAGYGLVNNLEGVGLSGSAVIIDNVTLKSGSSTLQSGLLGTYITTNGFAGCSAAFVVTIRNCTIEENVVIGYDKEQSMIGSFAGRVNGTIENCVSYASVYGKDYVGGILGTRDNAMGNCSIINCKFNGVVEAGGDHAGGIAGGGYSNQTAPNGGKVNIINCSSNASVTGKDKVGGILGADTYVLQLWGGHNLKDNYFNGKIKANDGIYAGGIIGYYSSLNKYDNISGNYYSPDCGTDKGIGFVKYIDTSCIAHENKSGAYYINTADGESGIGGITKTDLNRTDDPLGSDSGKLCYTDATPPAATQLIVSGSYQTEYTKGDKLNLSGIILSITYSNGKTVSISPEDVTITGFEPEKIGSQEITLEYMGLSAFIIVNVQNPKDEITVSVTILGDKKHDCETDGIIHTLADNNLEIWVPSKNYNVSSNTALLDLMNDIFKSNGITAFNPTGSYIESLTKDGITLKASDNHVNSGWMFTVNGVHGNLAVNQQYLNNGDTIIFHYTDDYTRESKSENNKDNEIAETVENLISAITDPVTLDSMNSIITAREAYNALTDLQKKLVKNYDILTSAEKAIAELKKTAEDEDAATVVEKLIASIIAPVTPDSENTIVTARNAYNSLTDLQKKLVDNYNELITAENLLIQLKNQAHDEIYKKAGDHLAKLGNRCPPAVGPVGGEWMIIGLARSGRNVPDGYYNNVLHYIEENINDKEQLNRNRSTDNSRIILALTSLGYDASDIVGHNLLKGLSDMSYIKKQGINGPVWALIAFDSHNYEIPVNKNAADQATREKLVEYILNAQLEDGGWSISGDKYDSDITSMALQALSPYCSSNEIVKSSVNKALALLSKEQNDDGSFCALQMDGSYLKNSESTAQVIAALTALGINPETDPRFIKNGNSAVDALCNFALENGGFSHTMSGELNQMSTEQCYFALAAYFRFLNGQTSLFNMNDLSVGIYGKPNTTIQTDDTQNTSTSVTDNNITVQNPQTGDISNTVIYTGFTALSLALLMIIITYKRKIY